MFKSGLLEPASTVSTSAAPAQENIASDTLEGVAKIAEHIGKTARQTYLLLESKKIPGFKLGGKWHLRKSTYARHIARLEAESAS